MTKIQLLLLTTFCFSYSIELEPIEVEEKKPSISTTQIYNQEHVNATTLAEKLQNSVQMNQISSNSNESQLSIRGNNFRATKYFEDGIPLYATSNGFVDLEMYNDPSLNTEINLGGNTGIYSVAATGGEVVLTSSQLKNGLSGRVFTSLGSNTNNANALLSYKDKNYYVKVNYSVLEQDAFILSKGFDKTPLQSSYKRVNSDKKQKNGYLKAGYSIDEDTHIAFKLSHLESYFGNPVNIFDEPSNPFGSNADYTRVDDKKLTSYWLYLDFKVEALQVSLRSYYDQYSDTYNFYDSLTFNNYLFDPSTYNDTRLGSILSFDYIFSDKHSGKATISIDQTTHQQVIENDPVKKNYATLESSLGYLHTYQFNDNLELSTAIKYLYQEPTKVFQFTNETIQYKNNEAVDLQFIAQYSLAESNQFYISLGQKNRFPSLVELYPYFPWDNPNTNVEPELAHNIELGIKSTLPLDNSINLSTYYNQVSNMIVYRDNTYSNIEEANIKGIEVQVNNYSFDHNTFEVSYAYTDAQDESNKRILYIPKSKLNIRNLYEFNANTELLVNYLYSSAFVDSYNSTTHVIDGYSLVDIQLNYVPIESLKLQAGVENMFDIDYAYRYAQPARGRDFFINLEYIF